MKTVIWIFPFCHSLHKLTLGKTKKEAGKDAWFDFFQQHEYKEKPHTSTPNLHAISTRFYKLEVFS